MFHLRLWTCMTNTTLCGMPSCSAHSVLGGSLALPYPRSSLGRIRHPHFLLPRPFYLPFAFLTVGCRVGWGGENGG
ncbi:hypothetical protein B0H14DRAFT_3059163, partial [Mycena olivaceomarginata]